MSGEHERKTKPQDLRKLLRNFILELVIYGILVIAYFFVVLQVLGGFLTSLFHNNLIVYAILGLILILLQGVFLDWVTSFLLDQLKLERFE